jgi:hypothetical protein
MLCGCREEVVGAGSRALGTFFVVEGVCVCEGDCVVDGRGVK